MMENIVYQGISRSGKEFLIRYPTLADAEAMSAYLNVLSDERTFITFQGEHLTAAEEKEFLTKELKRIAEGKSVMLLVFSENTLIGISNITSGERTSAHVGKFGISIAKEFRGEGIGKILMDVIHKEAEKCIPTLQIIDLGVFASNQLAKNMYQEYGYQEYGTLPGGVLYRGEYIDHIHMYKKIRS